MANQNGIPAAGPPALLETLRWPRILTERLFPVALTFLVPEGLR